MRGRRLQLLLAVVLGVTAAAGGPASAADGQVSGRVFDDVNANGIKDASSGAAEPGLPGATITAVDAAGAAMASTTSGPDGRFSLQMTNASSDTVRLQITPPDGFAPGPHHAGGGTTVEFVKLGSAENSVGLVHAAGGAVAEVGDRLWRDLDSDGVQDAGEPGIPGVTVRLWDAAGAMATALTDASGRFFFSSAPADATNPASRSDIRGVAGLRPGAAYSLRLDNPADYTSGPLAGLTLTRRFAGSDRAVDSNGEIINMLARASFTLAAALPCDHTHDLGFVPLPRRR